MKCILLIFMWWWRRLRLFCLGHLRSGLGFSARVVVNSGFVLQRLFPCHYVEYRGKFIYHIEETFPLVFIKPGSIIKSNREKSSITVHGNQR
ncbi:hypothetical protein M758_UG322200 [Ceratodon purpureus]|nr:hypothetical protein M758_UG322200 [Ceratodon purpureus]